MQNCSRNPLKEQKQPKLRGLIGFWCGNPGKQASNTLTHRKIAMHHPDDVTYMDVGKGRNKHGAEALS